MTGIRGFFLGIGLLVVAVALFVSTTGASPTGDFPEGGLAVGTPIPSKCVAGLQKWVDPYTVIFGRTADVTLVMTSTCPAEPLPIDIVIVADESYSMTQGKGPGINPTEPPTPPDPSAPPPPPTEPTPGTGGCQPPPYCGSSGIRTAIPTATPTRRWPPPPPDTPGLPTPVPTDVQEYAGGTDQIREMKQWVGDFIGDSGIEADMASGRVKIGFVSFNRRSVVRQNLSEEAGDVRSAANRLRGGDISRIQEGLREADRIANGTGSRPDAQKLVIILSDFEFCATDLQRMPSEFAVMTVGFGVDRCDLDKMQRFATSRKFIFEKGRARDVIDVFQEEFAASGVSVGIADLKIKDELTDLVALEAGSTYPPTVTITGQLIEWPLPLPSDPITVGYRVEPLQPGIVPVSVQAVAEWTDTLGRVGSAMFPEVFLDVAIHTDTPTPTSTPTATSTNTPTATATNTPTPADRYLPVLFKQRRAETPTPTATVCIPELQTADVGLVIDTSTSMNEPTQPGGQKKLDAAIEAAQALVSLLKQRDQTSVIGFNQKSYLLTGLTTDRAVISDAFARLPSTSAQGTSIYAGLAEAYAELTGPRHGPAHQRSIVLVTDGIHNDPDHDRDAVRQLANEIRDNGIDIITIGLGQDADHELLREIASSPDYYFAAPDAADLLEIYRQLADLIPCP